MRKIVYKSDIRKARKTLRTITRACNKFAQDPVANFKNYHVAESLVIHLRMAVFCAGGTIPLQSMTPYLEQVYRKAVSAIQDLLESCAVHMNIDPFYASTEEYLSARKQIASILTGGNKVTANVVLGGRKN